MFIIMAFNSPLYWTKPRDTKEISIYIDYSSNTAGFLQIDLTMNNFPRPRYLWSTICVLSSGKGLAIDSNMSNKFHILFVKKNILHPGILS